MNYLELAKQLGRGLYGFGAGIQTGRVGQATYNTQQGINRYDKMMDDFSERARMIRSAKDILSMQGISDKLFGQGGGF